MTNRVDINLDDKFYLNPYVEYRRLLEHSPVIWSERRKAWLVLGYEEIKTCLLTSSLSSRRTASSTLNAKDVYDEDNLHKLEGFYANWLMYMDGEQHAEIRRAVVRALNKSVIEDIYAYTRSLAQDLIKDLSREGSVNLLDELIMPYCGKLMLRVLGIPGLTYDELLELTENIVGFLGMSLFDSSVADKTLSDIVRLEKVIDGGNADVGGFVHLFLKEVTDFNLSNQTLVGLLGNMLVDGHEPMAYSITDGLYGLMLKYGSMAEALTDGVTDGVVEYLIHSSPPFQYASRIVTEDIVITDKTMKVGDRVLFLLGAGNRDHRVFTDEPKCPVHKGNATLSFGYGPHYCPGAKLARAALKILVEELLASVPTMRLATDAEHQWLKSLGYRQLQGLHVQFV